MSASSKRWMLALAGSVLICVLSFAYLNRDGCWLYWRGPAGLTSLLFFAIWFFLLLGFHWKGRVALLVVTVVFVLLLPGRVFWVKFAAAESRAVATLRSLKSDLEDAKARQPGEGYPQILPTGNLAHRFLSDSFHPTYRYDYVPVASPDGKIAEYVIRATPTRPECGCCLRSFTILNDGRIYSTSEQRPATILDSLLQ